MTGKGDIMKKITGYLLLAGFLTALLACNVQGTDRDAETIANELTDMRSILTGLEVTMALAVEPDSPEDFGSRTIAPTTSNADIAEYLYDESNNALSPAEVYTKFGGIGTNEVRVPSVDDGYFDDYYTESNQAYFYISKETEDYYRIKLYVYPRANFQVKYDYEEYLVDISATLTSWNWENMDEYGNAGQLITYKSYLADGTVAEKNIEWSSQDVDENDFADTGYAAFAVGADILNGDYSQYEFPILITEPVKDSGNNVLIWSSHTKSTISRNGISMDEFYTESGSDNYSGVIYLDKDRWYTNFNTVTRYEGNSATGIESVRKLSTTGFRGSIWQTETDLIERTVNTGIVNYDREYNVWWKSPESAKSVTSQYKAVVHLEESGVDTNSYSGQITEYWGTRGNTYNINLTNNNNGRYSFRRSNWATASRSTTSDLTVIVDQTDNFSFSLNVGSGSFSGNYLSGELVGTYTSNGSTSSVTINSSGVTVDNTDFSYDQLAD